ncbi:preprotein translocase subunit YajC [Cellulomonas massiliensis]|uniref:preprotein translocase subunit YajC n=1 Tax=Cellulomonas massiliensis TaxID=1465811 RepID=UPI0002EC1089|nr:preprotein translocase subunit YajC [Cellulomonas massiliensis]
MELILIAALAVGAMFWMSRRNQKMQRQQAEFRNHLEVGDEVMTASGLFGTVVDADDPEKVTLETEPGGAQTRWLRQAILRKVEPPVEDEYEDDAVDGTDETDPATDVADEPIDVPDDLSSLPPAPKKDGEQEK